MSQSGTIGGTSGVLPPSVATSYVTDSGTAVPALYVLNILTGVSAAGIHPLQSTGSGNTVTIHSQRSQAIAVADSTKVGLAAFDSASFAVDANGFVTFIGSGGGSVIPKLTYISTNTLAGVPSSVFTGLTNAFSGYRFYINITAIDGGGDVMAMQFSIDNGGTYINSNYFNSIIGGISNTFNASGGVAQTNIPVTEQFGIATSNGGMVDLQYPGLSDHNATLILYGVGGGAAGVGSGIGFYGTRAAVNAVKFFTEIGNNMTGTIILYGIT